MGKAGGFLLLTIIAVLNLTACGRIPTAKSNEPISAENITSGSAIQVSDPAVDALQAYYDILSQEKYRNEDIDLMKTYFAISDLDADGIPELLIHSTANIMELEQYYTYENGTVTEITEPQDGVGYPRSTGKLYSLPSRNTYAFLMKGSSGSKDDGNLYETFSLIEYTIKNHQIHRINDVFWEICESDSQTNVSDCTWNDKNCSLDDIINQYHLEKTKDENSGYTHFSFPSQEDSLIRFLPNTDTNRRAICFDSNPTIYALNAYYNLLSQEEYRNEEDEDTIMGTHFAISDLNTDGIPELLICGSSNILYLGEYYTYENGAVTKIEGPGEDEGYPVPGSLYTLPSRNTYAFFRGGPAWEEEEDGNGYMPYILAEYSLNMKDHQIHMDNYADWSICYYGSKAGTTECEINGKECSAEVIINQYSLKIEKTEDGWDRYYFPDKVSNYIELVPNTDANRKAIVTDTNSNEKTIGTDLDADRKATDTDSDSDQKETE